MNRARSLRRREASSFLAHASMFKCHPANLTVPPLRLNRIINCAQKLHPSQRQWFPFVVCLQVRKGGARGGLSRAAAALPRNWRGQACIIHAAAAAAD